MTPMKCAQMHCRCAPPRRRRRRRPRPPPARPLAQRQRGRGSPPSERYREKMPFLGPRDRFPTLLPPSLSILSEVAVASVAAAVWGKRTRLREWDQGELAQQFLLVAQNRCPMNYSIRLAVRPRPPPSPPRGRDGRAGEHFVQMYGLLR